MMPLHRVQALFTWLMVAACVLLGWTIQREITGLPSTQAAASVVGSAPGVGTDPAEPEVPVAAPSRDALAVIVERPVFSESRRPRKSDDGLVPALDVTLVGIVISDRQRSAIVQLPHGGAVQRLAEGAEVGGWVIVDIAPDHIVLRHDTTEAEMPLDYNAPAPPPPVATTPAPNNGRQDGAIPSGTKPATSEQSTEAQGIIPDQPPEVLPPPDDDDGDAQQSAN